MKFYLLEKKKIELKAPYNQDKHFLLNACITPHLSNNENAKELSSFKKFKHAFDQKYGILLESSPLRIDFQVNGENSANEPVTSWNIIVHGEILKALHDVVCCGSKNDLLQIHLTLQRYEPYNGRQGTAITAQDFFPHFELEGPTVHNRYEQINVKIPAESNAHSSYPSEWYISIEISKENFICLAEITPKFSETNRKILEEGKFCDFEIVVEDSTRKRWKSIPCHKTFLCANSLVFTRMLEGNFGEATENKMKMEGISVEGVNALLKFLYYSDVTGILDSSIVALELFRAADKYDIQPLWKVVTVLLLEEPHLWFDVDMALGLFDFLRNREPDGDNLDLKKKIIQVLALKSDQLQKSKLYGEIFSSPVAKDMFSLSLATNKP